MPVRIVRWSGLIATAVTLGALTAHVLELPNKFTLDGPLWLAVQQQLYRGWGLFIGPCEVAAVLCSWALAFLVRQNRAVFRPTLLAAFFLTGALVVFFILNAPVNAAFAAWTPATLPPDWPDYRLRWEMGHALSFVLVLPAFIALLRSLFLEAINRALQASSRS
ncbi:MAG: DUF1772 domain-containing protein [Thermodesulfobacteriota bacterium]